MLRHYCISSLAEFLAHLRNPTVAIVVCAAASSKHGAARFRRPVPPPKREEADVPLCIDPKADQRKKPMRRSDLSKNAAALFGAAVIIASLAGAPRHATAAVFNVTQNTWGTTSDVNSFAWAIDQANTQAGVDTINVAADLQINVDDAAPATGTNTWLARFTESANVQGNGATLVGNPAYVTTGGEIATKTNIVSSRYTSAIVLGDAILVPGLSFAQIGTSGSDNSSISVSFSDLSADGLASIAQLNEGAQLSVTGGDFRNIVNYTDIDAAGRGVFEANTGSTLNLSDISITDSSPFGNAVDVTSEAALFFGTIQGEDSQLNMQNSSINSSYGAGAIAWNGGTANIVSSIINDAGGLSVSDGATDGILNFVNSILYMTGGDDLSQTSRIQAGDGGEANIVASTILYDALATSSTGCAIVSYQCNGMPLTALLDGVLTFTSSAVVPLNAEFAFSGNDSYSEFTDGNLVAGEYSYVGATPTQDAAEVKSLFDNMTILTEGDTYDLIYADPSFELFNPLPAGAYPLLGGVLTRVIPNAGSGGVNALLNPIDGQPILFDVYGNPRTDANGFRDIGAVQVSDAVLGCEAAVASLGALWPPNHKLVPVDVLGINGPDDDPITVTIYGVFQDEPVNAQGDGNTRPDATGIGTSTASVRAEREGNGNGRVYTIYFTASSAGGAQPCMGTVEVAVPKSKNQDAVNDGPLFNSVFD